MSDSGRRLVTLLVVLAIVGAPAVALRAFCVGPACDEDDAHARAAPFCSLPAPLRDLLGAGFREGRSPDALGVTTVGSLLRSGSHDAAPWPDAATGGRPTFVPLAFVGAEIETGALPSIGLDDVASTIESLFGIRRPFPSVRSGEAASGVVVEGGRSSLVVTIVWKQAPADGDALVDAVLQGVEGGVAAGDAEVGSLPLDPAAPLTTRGTGGLPRDHGITGAILRGGSGDLVPAWSGRAPTSVIAALGDDLDEATAGEAMIGIVADRPTDRGLIGGTWYLSTGDEDDDDVIVERRDAVGAVERLLDRGYGDGGPSDLLGITLDAGIARVRDRTRAIIDMVLDRVPDATIVLTATGEAEAEDSPVMSPDELAAAVNERLGAPAVGAVAAGGLSVDQDVVTERNISSQRVVDAMASVRGPSGEPVFADAFPAFAVAFGRYC